MELITEEVSDGSFGGEILFPEALLARIKDSYRKRGWKVPGEVKQEGQTLGPGCSCGQGWLPILIELNEKLAELDPEYEIHQIKEKFGGLRYYVRTSFDSGRLWDQENGKEIIEDPEAYAKWEEFYGVINEAEHKCEVTCEACGEPGKIAGPKEGRGWLRCLCEEHRNG